jgi:competence protein ComEC
MTEATLEDGPARRPGRPRGARAAGVLAWLGAERERWPLWAPVALALGVAAYFALPVEPPPWSGPAAALAAAALAAALRGRAPVAFLALPLLVALGFAAAQARTALVRAPALEREIGPLEVEGRVVEIDRLEGGTRVTLDDVTLDRRDGGPVPGRARVRLRDEAAPEPGARVRVRAVLQPPPRPAAPGAYDFGRHLYFMGVGAVGHALGPAETVAPPEGGFRPALAAEGLRQALAAKVAAHLGGASGAIATALLTGEQTGIPAEAMEAMRASGLAHLISISGLHVGLVAGIVFWALRAALALVEPVALRRPIKKWAAAGALAAAAAYTLLVGAPVPTQRALLMTGLALAAVMADRNPFSMRLVAFAALAVLLVAPEALLGPSFQMSFAAVAALVAGFEALAPRLSGLRAGTGPAGRAALHLGGVALTSLLAGLATLPFSLYHFQQAQLYGVLSNMVAVPLTSFLVMPAGLLACAGLPFGLEGPPLAAMGLGLDAILAVARWTAGLPGAALPVPAMPGWGLGLAALGGAWLLLWTRRPRLLGCAALAAGLLSPALSERPDLLVGEEARLVALRDGEGTLLLSSPSAERFAAGVWLRRNGQEAGGGWSGHPDLRCDSLGCVWRAPDGRRVAVARRREALEDDCGAVELVVSLVPAGRRCRAPLVIDALDLRRDGVHAVYLSGGGTRVETVRAARGRRPWTGAERGER